MEGERDNNTLKYHSIGEIHIYSVTIDELNSISSFSDADIYLNFAVFFISSALTLLVALLTCECSQLVNIIFIVLCVLFGILGIMLIIIFFLKYRERKNKINEIKNRKLQN